MTAAIIYPAGDVTPHGWWHLINGDRPLMRLRAYDGSIDIYMMGGLAPPYNDPMVPEAVALKSLKGLIPPWKHIDQKGATDDGVTQLDALYDPTEIEAVVECIGRDARNLRRVYRDTIASIDAKQEAELSFLDLDAGYWWADVVWFQGAPGDPMKTPAVPRQQLSLRLRANNAFWQSYDDTDLFRFGYEQMVDDFSTDYTSGSDVLPVTLPFTLGALEGGDLGPNWPQYYTGAGGGVCVADGTEMSWVPSGTTEREVVNGPYKDFDTDTDNQVIEITLGSIPDNVYPEGAYNDIWGRMSANMDGTWAGDGIRVRVGRDGLLGWCELARFNDFVKTTLFTRILFLRPFRKETFTLVCGIDDDPRMFRVLRNGLTVLTHKEVGTGSELGAAFRGVGDGMVAGADIYGKGHQALPAGVVNISAGDNSSQTQSGFLKRTNIGDQPMYDDYTLFGPGTFRIYNGPGSDDYVEFGPTVANQVVYMRTDPRKGRALQDITSVPPTAQQLTVFQAAIESFEKFAFANNIPPLLQEINSVFGIKPPQGNIFSLLSGRFSDDSAIPAKSPGNPAQPYFVKVEIENGDADSKILAAGTPLRRYPL